MKRTLYQHKQNESIRRKLELFHYHNRSSPHNEKYYLGQELLAQIVIYFSESTPDHVSIGNWIKGIDLNMIKKNRWYKCTNDFTEIKEIPSRTIKNIRKEKVGLPYESKRKV